MGKYFWKNKNFCKEEKYFTDAQSKIINYALDDDVLGLKEYVNSTLLATEIDENYEELKSELKGYKFISETDTEVLSALIDKLYNIIFWHYFKGVF